MNDEKSENNIITDSEEEASKEELHNTEILENLPPEIKKVMEVGFSMQKFSGPLASPLLEKINEKHIDKILDLSEKEDERQYKDSRSSKIIFISCFVIVILLFVFLTMYLAQSNSELYMEILKLSVAFVGGLGGGFGIKSYIGSK
ncbi:MAG: hypothetical protein SCH39_01245 [Methanosarcinales archaeon]|nr:hypothetical protein [Methanosarcinales archaeon]